MATSKVRMKIPDPIGLINTVVSEHQLSVPEYIIRLEYYEDQDGASLTAFFSNETAVDNEPVSAKVTLGLSKENQPVFLEVFL